ncbi:AAA-like domain-containing protein [candidate division KSB1 bacterium]|nr:AAA-like domain-containing protein [candidate division KSB1 bacterium]
MRQFNITGKIIPEKHYFVDLTPQIEKLTVLAENGTYFVINRPRQFGKTTVLNFFAQHLLRSNVFLPILISFEGYGEKPDLPLEEFYRVFWHKVRLFLEATGFSLTWDPTAAQEEMSTFNFQKNVRALCKAVGDKKLVLLVDEVDAIPETAVISFLRALREMYLERDWLPTFHTATLAGVHDIKNLKARVRDESRTLGSASPFNIAIDYELPPFSLENIHQYYAQHTAETGQAFDEAVIARVHHVTNGHPWLVSVLAKTMVENIVPDRQQKIQIDYAEEAVQKLVKSRNPNFDSLFKNARRPGIFPIVLDLLIGAKHEFNIHSDSIDLGVKYGIFAEGQQQLILANFIYTQVLYQHFKEELGASEVRAIVAGNQFENENGYLDFRRVLGKFQIFMKAKGASITKHPDFREATGQLLLLSYLDLLVNGKGWTFKEVQSGEGRIDVLCCYRSQKEVVELKLWYGERKYEDGLEQLVRYLESESLNRGYLVVFDRRENAPRAYTFSEHEVAGKRIQAWVV